MEVPRNYTALKLLLVLSLDGAWNLDQSFSVQLSGERKKRSENTDVK